MSTVDRLREALAALPVSDVALESVSRLINKVEQENTTGAAAQAALQSARGIVEQIYLKRGDACPLCRSVRKHSPNCYLRGSGGWDLLGEHEATLKENDELRAALARYLPHNGAAIRSGGRYRSLKDQARMTPPSDT